MKVICLTLLFVVAGVSAKPSMPRVQPYFESRAALDFARDYVLERLPESEPDIHNREERAKLSLERLLGLIGEAVVLKNEGKENSFLDVIQEAFPRVYSNYTDVAANLRGTLRELNQKVFVVTDYMNSVCANTDQFKCDELTTVLVDSDPELYGKPAKLLLSVREPGNVLKQHVNQLNELLLKNNELPFLVKNAKSPKLVQLINKLAELYRLLQETPLARDGNDE